MSTNLQNGIELQQADVTCPATGYQPATVCVPVTVTPFAIAGTTSTKCCGNPIITPGTSVCPGVVNGSCVFTITQNICVSVPVEFGATSTVGAPVVQCGQATSEDVCTNCGSSGVALGASGGCSSCKSISIEVDA